jgi:hypothetical protein
LSSLPALLSSSNNFEIGSTEAAVAIASKQLGVSRWLAMEAVTKFERKAPPFALQYGDYRWT